MDGDRDMRNLLAITAMCLFLAGCDSGNKIFGIAIGGSEQELRKKIEIKQEDLIPSKVHFLEMTLVSAPENELGSDATYVVSSIDGKVVGVRAKRNDENEIYYSSMVAYAKNKLGDPIASEQGILNNEAVKSLPLGCAKNSSCPTPKYTAFRKGALNALVSSGGGETDIMFYDDDMQNAFK